MRVIDNTSDSSIKIRDQFQNITATYNLSIPEEFSISNEEARAVDSSRAAMLKKLLEQNWSLFEEAQVSEDDVIQIYENINDTIYNDFTKRLIYRRDEEVTEGFYMVKKGRRL